MLQQTQVARVVPRYEAWLERWPDAGGARRRAAGRRAARVGRPGLQPPRAAAARGVRGRRARTAGRTTAAATLPGVGPYTAAAVASFAFGGGGRRGRHERRAGSLERSGAPRRCRRGRGGGVEPGGDGARARRSARRAAAALRRLPAARAVPVGGPGRSPRAARAPGRASRTPTATPRAGRGGPGGRGAAADGLRSERLERALAGLERDGLVVRGRAMETVPSARAK